MDRSINIWIRFLFPFFLSVFISGVLYLNSQFREPPSFEWYGVLWFFSSVLIIWESGWWISKKLEQSYPWRKEVFKRLLLQLTVTNLIGVFLFLGTFLIINWYENQYENKLNPLGYLHILSALAQAFIIVQLVNSVQIGYQLLQSWQASQMETEAFKRQHVVAQLETIRRLIDPQLLNQNLNDLEAVIHASPDQAGTYLQELSILYQEHQSQLNEKLLGIQNTLHHQNGGIEAKSKVKAQVLEYKQRFLLRTGNRYFPIQAEEIVLFYKDELVFLLTHSSKKLIIDQSLEELINQLDPTQFFRINRQQIVHISYIQEFRSEGNQLILKMKIPFDQTLAVSQRNTPGFKRWVKGEL